MPDISLIAMIGAAPMSGIVCSAYRSSRFGSLPVPYDTAPPGGAADAVATSGDDFGGPGRVSLTVPTFEEYWVAIPSGGHVGWVKSPSPVVPESDVTALVADIAKLKNVWFYPEDYGAIRGGITDAYAALQACLTDAFNLPGGTMVLSGRYKSSATLVTPANTAGAVSIMSFGRVHSFLGGTNGDPVASGGATIEYSGNTGDIFLASALTGADARQYITIEGVTFQGNLAGGASGHGLHFAATGAHAILPALRDVTVTGCKQSGIFYDGNVMESTWFNVRSSGNGDRGFKAVPNGGQVPGEVRVFGASINNNLVGLDWTGAHFSAHGLTISNNTDEGVLVGAGTFTVVDLQMEENNIGNLAGDQGRFSGGNSFISLKSIQMTVNPSATGNGLSFVGCLAPKIEQYGANSSVAAAGYKDVRFDNATSRGTILEYISDDYVNRLALGTYGGHIVRMGSQWFTSQPRTQQAVSIAATGGVTPDATAYDELLVTATTAAITITINNPTMNIAFHNGQQMVVEIFNNTAGAITTAWNATYKFNGAWVDPGAGETRRILFSYNATRTAWYEIARTLFDASGNLSVPGAVTAASGNVTASSGQVRSFGAVAGLLMQNRSDLSTNWQWLVNGNITRLSNSASDVLTIDPYGAVSNTAQVYPGPEARGATQATGGILHSVGVPSNANGNNNDWCISDNGYLYFKAGGAWVQQAAADSLEAHLAGAETFTGSKTLADAVNIPLGTTTGSQIGTATAQKLALHGATPVIQRAGAAQVAAATTAPTNTTPYGYTTSAQAAAVITLLNEIRAALVEKGIIKGAA